MNLYAYLQRAAEHTPDQVAVYAPDWQTDRPGRDHHEVTFGALHARAGGVARGLAELGVAQGERVVLMVPVSIELYVVVAALFRLGAVPVLLDPWMGLDRMADCIRRTEPRVFVGVPLAHLLFLWRPGLRGLRRVMVGGSPWMGGRRLDEMAPSVGDPLAGTMSDDDPALITFTGGSTGQPKGVYRTHGLLSAQHEGTRRCMGVGPADVHMQAFPNMVMSNIASGATSVIPWFRQGHAAEADTDALLRQVRRFGVTGMCGPPALLGRLAEHCVATGQRMRSVRRALVGGSAVSFGVLEMLDQATRPGAAAVLYGSSEAEPLARLDGREAIARAAAIARRGGGLCMGHPSPGLDMEIRAIPRDHPPGDLADRDLLEASLAPGEIGELIVRGRHVSRTYFGNPDAEEALKIRTASGQVWHRLGDMGYLDPQGRVYLVGRTHDAVEARGATIHPLTVEPLIDELSFVHRSGLIGLPRRGNTDVVVAYEPTYRTSSRRTRRDRAERIRSECGKLGVHVDQVCDVASIPVDRRHNGKLERDQLVNLCARQLRRRAP